MTRLSDALLWLGFVALYLLAAAAGCVTLYALASVGKWIVGQVT